MSLQPNEYQCARCGNIYIKGQTDEEAMTETHSSWPGIDQQDCAVICDDCYQQIRPDAHTEVYRDSLPEEIMRKIIASYGVPPAVLEELNNTNRIDIESHMRAYKAMVFNRKREGDDNLF